MKLEELFTEAVYQISGPVRGTTLPLASNAGDSTETSIDLRDKRIDLDNPNGPTLMKKKSEAEQKQIVRGMVPGQQFTVIPKLTDVAELWFVVSKSPSRVVATQDPSADNPSTKEFLIANYYIDDVNQDGTPKISFAQERGIGEKSREINKLDRRDIPLNVESVSLTNK